jgi:hypothetical protein
MLLIDCDPERRGRLTDGLRGAGMSVVAVSRIAEIERWPAGEIVVTESRQFTEWWNRVGATRVIVLADTPEEGMDACARGASMWLARTCCPSALVSAIRTLSSEAG